MPKEKERKIKLNKINNLKLRGKKQIREKEKKKRKRNSRYIESMFWSLKSVRSHFHQRHHRI